jgi:hypothetical protein
MVVAELRYMGGARSLHLVERNCSRLCNSDKLCFVVLGGIWNQILLEGIWMNQQKLFIYHSKDACEVSSRMCWADKYGVLISVICSTVNMTDKVSSCVLCTCLWAFRIPTAVLL